MMHDFDSERQRLFTRRSLILAAGQSGLLGLLIGRMYYLQVTEGQKFMTLAEDNRINMRLLRPSRGLIFDRFGQKMAANEQNFQLMLVPEEAGNVNDTLKKLSRMIDISESTLKRIKRELAQKRKFMPIAVADKLTWEQAAAFQVRLPELPGVSIEVGEIRNYPFGDMASHVLGYVGTVSENDMKADPDPLLSVPGFQIGKTGIEKELETNLRGKAGSSDLEVNAFGRVIREVDRRMGEAGPTVNLSIDIELQRYVQQRLMTERSAACVVMDVKTGAIYAFASHPGYDPNAFSRGIDAASYKALMEDESRPLTNKVLAGVYSPGSTFKVATALAALESGVGAEHTALCLGAIEMGNHYFHCWKRGGHGTLDMIGGMRESCDVYFYDLARKIGIDAIAKTSRALGLGSVTGIDMPGEKPGLIPDRAWKEANKKEAWLPGESLVNAIGQGYVLTTPLQLAVMVSRIVNGGYAVKPHVIKEIGEVELEKVESTKIGFNKHNLAVIIAAMNAVCLDKRGTAFGARIKEEGMEMGGKTGTAQVRRITLAERREGIVKNEDRPWMFRDHALFVGYAPVGAPRYAISVVVEHGGGGSAVAGPIARDILLEAQRLDPTRAQRPPVSAAEYVPTPGAVSTPSDEESDGVPAEAEPITEPAR